MELIRDVSTDLLGGQIYGTKYEDANGNGLQDEGEAGLAGWTIYIDDNLNNVLDPGERSTVTDSQGNYSFVGLETGVTYRLAEVAQPLWSQTGPVSGGSEELLQTDFSDGSTQTLRVVPDAQQRNPTTGTFLLRIDSRTTGLIQYAGPNATTAGNIETALQEIVDPGVAVQVTAHAGSPITFDIDFTLRGVGTPVDYSLVNIAGVALDHGNLAVDTVGSEDGFTSSGAADQWHLSEGRGRDTGHSGQQSYYFGAGETEIGGGVYQNNADGTLSTPEINLQDQRITGQLFLALNHFLSTESNYDYASIDIVDSLGNTTSVFSSSTSTSGFQPLLVNLTPFIGQSIHVNFTFDSDGGVTQEGWYVDDIRVFVERGVHDVTLSDAPQGSIVKDVDFGGQRRTSYGPDAYDYEAFVVGPDFQDITDTGNKTMQQFSGVGYALQAGGTGTDEGHAVTLDASGNSYVTGSFTGQATFGEGASAVTLTAVGNSDIFVAKYDADGQFLWAISMGGTGSDSGSDVQLDSTGHLFVAGRFSMNADFDPTAATTSLTSLGGSDAFVACYDTDGQFVWARQFGGTLSDAATALATDSAGNVIVTGYFSGTVDFDPGAGIFNQVSAGDNDIFVAKLATAGSLVWARRYGSTGTDQGLDVTLDHTGRIIVGGSYSGTVDFDPGPGTQNLSASALTDGFVLSVTANGATNWARGFGGSNADATNGVAVDSSNNVVAVGIYNGDISIRKYSASGASLWNRLVGGDNTDSAESVAVDSLDRIFVTGSYRKTVDFDPGSKQVAQTSVGGRDIFAARYTAAGNLDLVRVAGGTLDDVGYGIAIDAAGNPLYTGLFRQSIDADIGADLTFTDESWQQRHAAGQAVDYRRFG